MNDECCQCCNEPLQDSSFGEICPMCGWEQDYEEDLEKDFGPNGVTLSQYKIANKEKENE